MSEKEPESRHTARDADVLRVIGVFLVVLSLPVAVGTIWAGAAVPALINLAAAALIMGIGATMFWRGRRPPK